MSPLPIPPSAEIFPPPPPELFDASGHISQDVSCRRCAYNLRGLTGDGRCPECGTPVGRSTHGDLLRYSDPGWVEKLELGARLILWGMLVGIIAGVARLVLSLFLHPVVGDFVALAGAMVGFYGTWLLTEPDPSNIGEDVYGRARQITRITLLIGIVTQVGAMMQYVVHLTRAMLILGIPLALLLIAIGVVGIWYQLLYVEKLAERIPEHDVTRRARFLRWAYPISMGVAGVGAMIILAAAVFLRAAPATGPGGIAVAGSCLAGLAGLAVLVFGIMYIAMLFKLRRAFQAQAATARAFWRPSEN